MDFVTWGQRRCNYRLPKPFQHEQRRLLSRGGVISVLGELNDFLPARQRNAPSRDVARVATDAGAGSSIQLPSNLEESPTRVLEQHGLWQPAPPTNSDHGGIRELHRRSQG